MTTTRAHTSTREERDVERREHGGCVDARLDGTTRVGSRDGRRGRERDGRGRRARGCTNEWM